ncbi:hypothetical protein DFS34DRAFT_655258 [Phlyctochytrium arcticum]|nr:hypothetical protein DFS34DRAFT_655258 [Phlyctochytrium arcticum]
MFDEFGFLDLEFETVPVLVLLAFITAFCCARAVYAGGFHDYRAKQREEEKNKDVEHYFPRVLLDLSHGQNFTIQTLNKLKDKVDACHDLCFKLVEFLDAAAKGKENAPKFDIDPAEVARDSRRSSLRLKKLEQDISTVHSRIDEILSWNNSSSSLPPPRVDYDDNGQPLAAAAAAAAAEENEVFREASTAEEVREAIRDRILPDDTLDLLVGKGMLTSYVLEAAQEERANAAGAPAEMRETYGGESSNIRGVFEEDSSDSEDDEDQIWLRKPRTRADDTEDFAAQSSPSPTSEPEMESDAPVNTSTPEPRASVGMSTTKSTSDLPDKSSDLEDTSDIQEQEESDDSIEARKEFLGSLVEEVFRQVSSHTPDPLHRHPQHKSGTHVQPSRQDSNKSEDNSYERPATTLAREGDEWFKQMQKESLHHPDDIQVPAIASAIYTMKDYAEPSDLPSDDETREKLELEVEAAFIKVRSYTPDPLDRHHGKKSVMHAQSPQREQDGHKEHHEVKNPFTTNLKAGDESSNQVRPEGDIPHEVNPFTTDPKVDDESSNQMRQGDENHEENPFTTDSKDEDEESNQIRPEDDVQASVPEGIKKANDSAQEMLNSEQKGAKKVEATEPSSADQQPHTPLSKGAAIHLVSPPPTPLHPSHADSGKRDDDNDGGDDDIERSTTPTPVRRHQLSQNCPAFHDNDESLVPSTMSVTFAERAPAPMSPGQHGDATEWTVTEEILSEEDPARNPIQAETVDEDDDDNAGVLPHEIDTVP